MTILTRSILLLALPAAFGLIEPQLTSAIAERGVHSLDKGWRFMLDGKGASSHSTPVDRAKVRGARSVLMIVRRTVNLPHDFVVEGNFTQTADMAHGYLP